MCLYPFLMMLKTHTSGQQPEKLHICQKKTVWSGVLSNLLVISKIIDIIGSSYWMLSSSYQPSYHPTGRNSESNQLISDLRFHTSQFQDSRWDTWKSSKNRGTNHPHGSNTWQSTVNTRLGCTDPCLNIISCQTYQYISILNITSNIIWYEQLNQNLPIALPYCCLSFIL